MWLLRSVFDPSSGSCTAFCDTLLDSPIPEGVERWQWVSFDPMVGAAGIQWEEHELTIERVPPTVEQAAVALLTKGIRVTRYTMVPGRPVDGGQPRPGTRCAEHHLRLSSAQDSLELDTETIPIEVISSVIYGPASPTLDRMRASETLAPLVAPCDCFAVSSSQAGVETSYDFAALDARSARAVVIVLALLKSGRTFSGMLLWHGAQMRLRSLACGLGPQTFSTGPASSVLQMRARERALAAVLRQTADEIMYGEEPGGGAVVAPPVPPPSIPSLMGGADDLLSSGDELDDGGPIAPPGKLPPGWDVVEASAGVFYVNSVTNTAQKEFPTESALPPGWDIFVSSTGEEYYMNMDTGQRSLELPMADVDAGGQLAAPSIGGAPSPPRPAPAPAPAPHAGSGAARDVFKLDMRPGAPTPVRKSRALQLAMRLRQRQEEQARLGERDVAAAPGSDRPDDEDDNEISVSVDEMRAIEEDAQQAAGLAGGGAGRPAVPSRRPPMVPKSKPPSRPAPQAPSRKPPSRPAPRAGGGGSAGSPGPSSPSRRPPQRPAPSVAPPGIGGGADSSADSPGSRAPNRKPPSTPQRPPPRRPT